jgi:two-component system nitrate/nitrite response regulator NarL
MKNYKIIIADDHPLLIDGIRSIISSEKVFDLCAVASNGKQLLQIIPLHNPDLIIMDINLPEIDGIEAATFIKNTHPEILILCISTYYSKGLLDKLRAIPVEGFIPKQSDSRVVLQTIKQVIDGGHIFIKSPKDNIYKKEDPVEIALLSTREKEIVRLIKKGLSTKEIAEGLYLSAYTVDTHRKNICQKLNLTTPGALLRYISEKDF